MASKNQKVIVYIDGFNFYYGLKVKPWKKCYWLDIVKLMESFLKPNQELVAVKFLKKLNSSNFEYNRFGSLGKRSYLCNRN